MAGVITPAVLAAPTLSLTTHASSGFINGAFFLEVDEIGTGSGNIKSFVRIQELGPANDRDGIQEGYNTDYRPVSYDENVSPIFTHALQITDIPTVVIDGISYREFLLDTNQDRNNPQISLDKIQIYQANSGSLFGPPAGLGTLVYDLDTGGDNWILLDSSLEAGSGEGDMFAYIPDSVFNSSYGSYVYLYSMFGQNVGVNGGFEEWAVKSTTPVVPAPGALILASLGAVVVSHLRRRALI